MPAKRVDTYRGFAIVAFTIRRPEDRQEGAGDPTGYHAHRGCIHIVSPAGSDDSLVDVRACIDDAIDPAALRGVQRVN